MIAGSMNLKSGRSTYIKHTRYLLFVLCKDRLCAIAAARGTAQFKPAWKCGGTVDAVRFAWRVAH